MNNLKNSLPPKESNLKRAGIGCSILTGTMFIGLIIIAIIVGFNISTFFGNSQVGSASLNLDDKTSPELVATRQEKEQNLLLSYSWIDKEANQVRIPIDQAMVLIAETGLPVGSKVTEEPIVEATLPALPSTSEASDTPPSAGTPGSEEETAATPESDSNSEETLSAEPTVNLEEVSFSQHVLPILEEHCVQCHGGEDPEGGQRVEEGLNLTNYDDILLGSFNGPVVEPGDVEDSYLIDQIVTGRMPKEGPRVPPDQIEIISAWVEAGALDN